MNISKYTTLCLKLAGLIFILSFLLDTLTFAIPFQWQNSQWQIGFVTAIVDRGIVPMVGMVLIVLASWIDSTLNTPAATAKASTFLKIFTFILASLLGLLFLLLIPIHFNNINQVKTNALEQIQKGADQGEEQIKQFLANLNNLSQNPQLLTQEIAQRTQVIESGQFQGRPLTEQQLVQLRQQKDQLQNLRDLARKPADFKKRLDEIRNQLQTQLLDRRREAENQANTEALKQWLRICLSSLMLAIGYSVIGWLGLRGVGLLSGNLKESKR